MSEARADIALIGLAVMGQNLVMNMNDHGFTVSVYNRTASVTEEFLSTTARGSKVISSSIGSWCPPDGMRPKRCEPGTKTIAPSANATSSV